MLFLWEVTPMMPSLAVGLYFVHRSSGNQHQQHRHLSSVCVWCFVFGQPTLTMPSLVLSVCRWCMIFGVPFPHQQSTRPWQMIPSLICAFMITTTVIQKAVQIQWRRERGKLPVKVPSNKRADDHLALSLQWRVGGYPCLLQLEETSNGSFTIGSLGKLWLLAVIMGGGLEGKWILLKIGSKRP